MNRSPWWQAFCKKTLWVALFPIAWSHCINTTHYTNIDLSKSTLTASAMQSVVDRPEPIVLTLQLKNKADVPIADIPVRLEALFCTIEQAMLQTDSNGWLTATLTSHQVGKTVVKAALSIGSYQMYLDQVLELEFLPQPAVVSSFQVITPDTATAGVPFVTVIRAVDANQQLVTTYQGVVHVYSGDPNRPFVQSFVVGPEHQGVLTLPGIMYTANQQTLLVQDSNNPLLVQQSQPIMVTPSQAAQLQLQAAGQWMAGDTQAITLDIKDKFGNLVPTYQGQITLLRNNHSIAVLTFSPSDGGRKIFSDTIYEIGTYTYVGFSAQDVSILSTPLSIQVAANAPAHFSITYANNNINQGATTQFTLHATDAWGNRVTHADLVWSLELSRSADDPNLPPLYDSLLPDSTCPATVQMGPADGGEIHFACTFHQLGIHALTVTSTQLVPEQPQPILLEVLRVLSVKTSLHNSKVQSTCALLSNRQLKCWGANDVGQLGLGDIKPRGLGPNEMADHLPYVRLGTHRKVMQYSMGSGYACAALDNGESKCWGKNNDKLSYPDYLTRGDDISTIGDNLPAITLGLNQKVIYIAAGASHSCAILESGELKCFGRNASLGYGDVGYHVLPTNDLNPIPLGTGRTPLSIDLGWFTRCALLDNLHLKCWGDNWAGTDGLGDTTNRTEPWQMGDNLPSAQLGTGRTVVSFGSNSHNCAVLDNGTLKCWGYGPHGALGHGENHYVLIGNDPSTTGDNMPAVQLGTGRTALQVTTSSFYSSCALLDNHRIKCWGANGYGEIAEGITGVAGYQVTTFASYLTGDAMPYIELGTNRTVVQMAVTHYAGCALLDDGGVKCWGGSSSGNLGLGDNQLRGTSAAHMGDTLPYVILW